MSPTANSESLPQTNDTAHAMSGSNGVENVVIAGAGPAGLMLA